MAFAACSPAIMLAVERANMDIAMFSLVASSFLWWQTFPGTAPVISPVLILLAAVAKIYPIFALPVFVITRSRTALIVSLLGLAGVRRVPGLQSQATFSRSLGSLLRETTTRSGTHPVGPSLPPDRGRPLGGSCCSQAIDRYTAARFGGYRHWRSVRRRLASTINDATSAPAPLMCLHAGSFVYLGTFAVGKNFDYRLVFLLLTLPQLCMWARISTHQLSSLASASVVAILALLWVGSLSQLLALWDELASWIVAGLLTAVTSPRCRASQQSGMCCSAAPWYRLERSPADKGLPDRALLRQPPAENGLYIAIENESGCPAGMWYLDQHRLHAR